MSSVVLSHKCDLKNDEYLEIVGPSNNVFKSYQIKLLLVLKHTNLKTVLHAIRKLFEKDPGGGGEIYL